MIRENRYRLLGESGIKVSPLGAGTNRWTQGKNDEAVSAAFQSLLGAGVNFFDTAEIYNQGKSERLLGACLRREPHTVVVASKFAPYPTRLSRRQFMRALDHSLGRLGLETIDLYYIHFPFTLVSVERLMDMMAEAVEEGKVRAAGVSNFSAEQMRRAATRLDRYHLPLAANQVRYDLLHRQPETNGVLEACRELNVALVAYRPLERGRLTGDVSPEAAAGPLSPRKGKAAAPRERLLMDTLRRIALEHEKSVSQVALNWLLARDAHVIPIPGATSTRHALENVGALTWDLSDDEFAAIDRASSL